MSRRKGYSRSLQSRQRDMLRKDSGSSTSPASMPSIRPSRRNTACRKTEPCYNSFPTRTLPTILERARDTSRVLRSRVQH